MQLNNAQYKAVHHVTGPMLVTAGPGSGKTRVIVERIKYLVTEADIKPSSILVVTFTRAAAMEMRQRYETERGRQGVFFGTFHSIFFMILKNAYKFTAADILRDDEQKQFIRAILPRLSWNTDNEKDTIADIITEISRVKSENYDIESYYPLSCPAESFRTLYKEYNSWLREKRKIDFDDMMLYTYDLFKARPDILALWQRHFRYILVDEFQDINMIQYEILKMLAKPLNNLFIVGDDDQSIYSFRGSKPEYMINFGSDYPDSVRVALDINYRCSGNIIKSAARLISNNTNRISKNITAAAEDGLPVDVKAFKTLVEQNKAVVEQILEYHEKDVPYADMAVLYRTNSQPQALVHTLMEYDIPIRLKEGMPNIYNHWIALDIIAYAKLALGIKSADVFVRVMNKPNRYISRSVVGKGTVDYDNLAAVYEEKPWMRDRIYQLESDIKAVSRMTPSRGFRYIDKVIGYGDYLAEYAEDRGIPLDGLREKLDEICGLAADFKSYGEWLDYIDEYTERLKDNYNVNDDVDAVMCMTMHGSKGLEFDKVIIPDVNEGIIPHNMSTSDEQIEEERRMMYVAMTRAKTRLHLFYTEHRYNRDYIPSRFIREIAE